MTARCPQNMCNLDVNGWLKILEKSMVNHIKQPVIDCLVVSTRMRITLIMTAATLALRVSSSSVVWCESSHLHVEEIGTDVCGPNT